ncbi:MAG: hypothetical protein L6Q53_06070 [Candidatus Brocadia sinica]|nr:hypothetical protein [Candidatus Brocadia sinica]
MKGFSDRFSRLTSGKFSGMVLDVGENSDFPKVLTPSGWVKFEGTGGDIFDSIPLKDSEVETLSQ